MNAGGLATVPQPIPQSATVPHDSVPQLSESMTCDHERLSAGSLELRARLAGSLDKMKAVAQRAKRRQDAARPALVKRERQDQHKYHSRYLESALKQHAEQQAKSREMPSMLHGMSQHLRMAHAFNTFAPAPGHITPLSVRSRKRQSEGMQEWPTQGSLPMQPLTRPSLPPAFRMPSEHTPLLFNQQPNPTLINNDLGVTTSPSTSSLQAVRTDRTSSTNDIKSMAGLGKEPAAVTPQAMPMPNGQAMPELADSQMMNLMDQFGPGNPLSDLGDGCLEGVLAGQEEQPPTPSLSAHSEQSPINRASVNSNSLVSPSSVGGTPTAPSSVPSCGAVPSNNTTSPASVHNLSNGTVADGYGGNPLGAPLDSSTPSTSTSSSCCYSQMPSTSAYPPACTQSIALQRVQYPIANPQGDVLGPRSYPSQQQQHQMMIQSQHAQVSSFAQQRFIYPCMNGDGALNESNALLRMRQSVDELSTNVEKRAGFVPRFMEYANVRMKQEPACESFATSTVPSRVQYPQSVSQIQSCPLPNQHMFSDGNYHLQQASLHGSPTTDYPYPIRMGRALNQRQMAMYQLNGHMVSEQQAPLSEQYTRSIYNYRYC